jgi:hypothetical protein
MWPMKPNNAARRQKGVSNRGADPKGDLFTFHGGTEDR